MSKTILITGATDGLGLATATALASAGHHVLIHGRNAEKLATVHAALADLPAGGSVRTYQADLSELKAVHRLAEAVLAGDTKLDVLINNAGVFKLNEPATRDGLDMRFLVNTLAPYALTKALLGNMAAAGRVVNLASAAQAPVDWDALTGAATLSDNAAYAQSKLALVMWSMQLAEGLPEGPAIIAVNPASFLASKMVKQAYGVAGNDLNIGVDVLVRAALSEEFAHASGRYYDNDRQAFADPHPFAQDPARNQHLVEILERILTAKTEA
ncbi:MAG: SDR family NAD(P)-dependent oxidoreductase [Pseudomonadota bacterium]